MNRSHAGATVGWDSAHKPTQIPNATTVVMLHPQEGSHGKGFSMQAYRYLAKLA